MTKFEEESKKELRNCGVIANSYSSFDSVPERAFEKGLVLKAGFLAYHLPWLEFAKNWHSDEEFQKLLEQNADWSQECKNINKINAQLTKENEDLKSQLQQQALPVVPEFVDKFLKSKPIFNIVKYPIPIEIITWANKQTGYMDLEINITYLVKLKANGYTVEKPQLFYLKHIDFCKTDKHYDWFIIKHSDGPLNHLRVEKGQNPSTIDCKFTQQEIDSMKTGSYEQIKVEGGE